MGDSPEIIESFSWVLPDRRNKIYFIWSILKGKSTASRTMKIAKIPIELYGQSFAPLVPIYCMVLWLIQQPIPAPQQPCWGSQVTSKLMHDSLPGFLNPAPVAMVQWQSTSPSGIWYFSFATCFLIEVSHQQSPSTSDLRQISQQAAVEHKWLPAKIKTQGRHWTVRVQKSFFSWIS